MSLFNELSDILDVKDCFQFSILFLALLGDNMFYGLNGEEMLDSILNSVDFFLFCVETIKRSDSDQISSMKVPVEV